MDGSNVTHFVGVLQEVWVDLGTVDYIRLNNEQIGFTFKSLYTHLRMLESL
jgi:hypothetical protein